MKWEVTVVTVPPLLCHQLHPVWQAGRVAHRVYSLLRLLGTFLPRKIAWYLPTLQSLFRLRVVTRFAVTRERVIHNVPAFLNLVFCLSNPCWSKQIPWAKTRIRDGNENKLLKDVAGKVVMCNEHVSNNRRQSPHFQTCHMRIYFRAISLITILFRISRKEEQTILCTFIFDIVIIRVTNPKH